MAAAPLEISTPSQVRQDDAGITSLSLRIEGLILALISAVMGIGGSIYLILDLHLIRVDALARVVNAYYTIFSPKFHLAAIGFVWNPLPSLLELPLVLMHNWFPSLLTYGYAGSIISALSGALGVYLLNSIFFNLGVPRFWRISLSLLYMVNPMIWMFEVNGMSESLMIATMLGSINGAIAYLRRERTSDLLAAGIWLAVCFSARYEAVPFGIFLALAFAVALRIKGQSAHQIQANLIVAGLPLITAGIFWVWLNWEIMGNPLYFFDSSYSNAGQVGTGEYNTPIILRDAHHWLYSLFSVAHFTLLFPPVIVGLALTLIVIVFRRHFRPAGLVLVATTVAIPLFQLLMLYKHASAMWTRFFILYIPSGFLLLALIGVVVAKDRKFLRNVVFALISGILLAGNFATLEAVQQPSIGRVNVDYFQAVLQHKTIEVPTVMYLHYGKIIAQYINDHPNLVVLLDTFNGVYIIPFIQRRSQLVITNDLDFQSVLLNPRGRVTSFLVPSPEIQTGSLGAVNRAYPGLWYGKVSWATRVKSFAGPYHFALFSIGPSAP